MNKAYALIFGFCLLVLITSCGSPSPSSLSKIESPLPTQAVLRVQSPVSTPAVRGTVLSVEIPSEVPTPQEGKAAVSGVLYTFTGKGPVPGTVFYLTPAKGEDNRPPVAYTGPNEEAGDVAGQSNEKGQIALNNIPPGSYYLVVWAPYNWVMAVESDVDMTTPRLIQLSADQKQNLGKIYVGWP